MTSIKMFTDLCESLGRLTPWYCAVAMVIMAIMIVGATLKVAGEQKLQYMLVHLASVPVYCAVVGTVAHAVQGGTVNTTAWVLLTVAIYLSLGVSFAFAKGIETSSEAEEKRYGVRAVPCPPRISEKDIPSLRNSGLTK